MDTTDPTAAAPPPHSQSSLPSVLWWSLLAVVLFRVVTAVMDRGDTASEGLIRWRPRERAPALSQTNGRPILYDFTAAWCGPCKLLDRDWADADVAEKVNGSFVPARVVDRQREDGKNPSDVAEMMHRFDISGFPTLVAASADGKMIAKLEGYRGRAALMEFLEEASKPGAAPAPPQP